MYSEDPRSQTVYQWEFCVNNRYMGFLCEDGLDITKLHDSIQHTVHKGDSCVSGTLDTAQRVFHLSSPHCTYIVGM